MAGRTSGVLVATLHGPTVASACNALGNVVSVEKGAAIYCEGDPATYWYEVVDGTVRTCRFLADGHRQLTGFFYPDDVFGVDGPHHPEAAEAVTDVVLRRHLARDLQDDGAVGNAADLVLHKALASARRSIFMFGHRTAANRVAAFLIGAAERSRDKGLVLPMTRNDIADHLNLTLHTVSRTISDFSRKGMIALDGPQKVRILALEKLRVLAGEADRGDGAPGYPLLSTWKNSESREPA